VAIDFEEVEPELLREARLAVPDHEVHVSTTRAGPVGANPRTAPQGSANDEGGFVPNLNRRAGYDEVSIGVLDGLAAQQDTWIVGEDQPMLQDRRNAVEAVEIGKDHEGGGFAWCEFALVSLCQRAALRHGRESGTVAVSVGQLAFAIAQHDGLGARI